MYEHCRGFACCCREMTLQFRHNNSSIRKRLSIPAPRPNHLVFGEKPRFCSWKRRDRLGVEIWRSKQASNYSTNRGVRCWRLIPRHCCLHAFLPQAGWIPRMTRAMLMAHNEKFTFHWRRALILQEGGWCRPWTRLATAVVSELLPQRDCRFLFLDLDKKASSRVWWWHVLKGPSRALRTTSARRLVAVGGEDFCRTTFGGTY